VGNESAFITFSTPEARNQFNLNANTVLQEQLHYVQGNGGGTAKWASGGTSDPRGGEVAAQALQEIVKKLTTK
jgi:alanyl-tRNA synthetase